MSIACLGWGSLIWRPGELKLSKRERPWNSDGPAMPIEFARQSDNGLITLVIAPGTSLVRVLWADVDFEDVNEARAHLAARERTSIHNIEVWSSDNSTAASDTIAAWAVERQISSVIWTNLKPQFASERGRVPSSTEAIKYLKSLREPTRSAAEEYVRQAPSQILTPYRAKFEIALGWTYDGTITDQQIRRPSD